MSLFNKIVFMSGTFILGLLLLAIFILMSAGLVDGLNVAR